MHEELEARLATLPARAQLAFAAICAERAVAEALHVLEAPALEDPLLVRALSLLWEHIRGEPVRRERLEGIQRELRTLLEQLAEGQESESVCLAAHAVECAVAAALEPGRTAALCAAGVEDRYDVLAGLYDGAASVELGERAWQETALERLGAAAPKDITRELFQAIEEFERTPLQEES
jgi:hypothetical protein